MGSLFFFHLATSYTQAPSSVPMSSVDPQT
jgi:hypothetical protein